MSMAHGHAGEENTDGCRTYECGFVWIEEIQIMGERNVIKQRFSAPERSEAECTHFPNVKG